MGKTILFNSFIVYTFIMCTIALGKAFAINSTIHVSSAQHTKLLPPASAEPVHTHMPIDELLIESDSIEFDVEVVQSRKFFLSFTMKRGETFFIKIYDIIGNLIHHEVVSKKGWFRKQYDLSKYKTDLYVIEVGSGRKAKIKRLFLG
ncbi:hypothetical protein Q0590_07735 [Rhodocytophaga aerolata]|uniref:T9SS type A sorting domain-containing protein n=2 Tax=Rhodocytophaga aerolata TaxID=455078 RepID=A0ABT8R214_9BACT|nr:hypothetical protein [Rhodocytophaga aerolata]MDO1446137.1 hypothetical protein [Rhodocytophaga aerolata]